MRPQAPVCINGGMECVCFGSDKVRQRRKKKKGWLSVKLMLWRCPYARIVNGEATMDGRVEGRSERQVQGGITCGDEGGKSLEGGNQTWVWVGMGIEPNSLWRG